MDLKEFIARGKSVVQLKKVGAKIAIASRCGDQETQFGPSSLNLMMIDVCNSGCIMCGYDYKACGSAESLTLDKMKSIYSHLDTSQLVEVIYGGGGEPFLNHDLSDIAAYTKKKCPSIQHTVISNFISADYDVIEKLINCRVNFLISINAATRETYKTISGIDAFEKVCENIKKVVNIRNKEKSMADISVSIILMRQNIEELKTLVNVAHDLGVDGVKSVYVRIYPDKFRKKVNGNILISPEDSLFFHQETSNKEIRRAADLAKKMGTSFNHQPLFGCNRKKERNCKEPWKSLFVNFNGDLFPCAAGEILFMNKVASGYYHSGNIIKQPIEEIWNNPFWKSLRKTNAVKDRIEVVPECLCCGMAIDWLGPDCREAHIMNWDISEQYRLQL